MASLNWSSSSWCNLLSSTSSLLLVFFSSFPTSLITVSLLSSNDACSPSQRGCCRCRHGERTPGCLQHCRRVCIYSCWIWICRWVWFTTLLRRLLTLLWLVRRFELLLLPLPVLSPSPSAGWWELPELFLPVVRGVAEAMRRGGGAAKQQKEEEVTSLLPPVSVLDSVPLFCIVSHAPRTRISLSSSSSVLFHICSCLSNKMEKALCIVDCNLHTAAASSSSCCCPFTHLALEAEETRDELREKEEGEVLKR